MLGAGKWMELKVIMLSEIIQLQKDNIACFLSYVESICVCIWLQMWDCLGEPVGRKGSGGLSMVKVHYI
jgi:hypothetical protein